MWPRTAQALREHQCALARSSPDPWYPPEDRPLRVGACWVSFPRGSSGPGAVGDPAWCAAVVMAGGRTTGERVQTGRAGDAYVPGLMALRVGPLLESVVRTLPERPDVLLLDATARDHPRRCGLAVHLGHVLDLPTVGVTHRPLQAHGGWPADETGASTPLRIGEEVVGCWLRTRAATRPLAVHPGWRVDLGTALRVLRETSSGRRTPEPLRRARHLARRARAGLDPSG